MTSRSLIGTELDQIPVNAMLGGLAYQSPENATIKNLDLRNIAEINAETTDTAKDVFVYDTSKDSDGGAWRQRTQRTSWYNETLNTATRGSRREFPAVAVIVAEATQLTIYDGDDPDLPMWMVFNTTSGNLIGGSSSLNAVTALNGIMVTGASGYCMETRFISDYPLDWFTNQLYEYNGNIEQRNDTLGFTLIESYGIVDSDINDVAMTVLPRAPIDPDTGLQVPTIAIGTDEGVSVIKDDGNVVDITATSYDYTSSISFTEDNELIFSWDSNTRARFIHVYDIPSSDVSHGGVGYQYGAGKRFYTNYGPVSKDLVIWSNTSTSWNTSEVLSNAIGHSEGLTLLDENPASPANGMVAYATTSYNTGYMVGDIKGAFLSDTDTTNVSADTLNSVNTFDGTFATSTGWTADSDWTISSGVATCNGNNSGRFLYPSTDRWPEESSVVVEVTVTAYTSGTLHVSYATGAATSGTDMTATGTYKFVNNVSGNDLIYLRSESFVGSVDNIKIYYAEYDRSVNNKGLIPYGTVTKSAVATGSELVAYSGFSNNNVLVQPHNSDLDPGTGDYSFMCWFKCSSTSAEQMIMRRFGVPTVTGGMMMRVVASSSVLQWYVRDTLSNATSLNSTMALDDGIWHCAVGIRQGDNAKLYIDGKLNRDSTCSANSHDPGTTADLVIGAEESSANPGTYQNPADSCSLALVRYSLSVPSSEQVKKIYDDEKVLFQENAACTLYGSSDAVTALAYDDSTSLLHAGTSSGRSDFTGLKRINHDTSAVSTAISAQDGLIAQQ